MGNLIQHIGTSEDRSLLADVRFNRIGVAIFPGEGELERGTIIMRDASGMYKAAVSGSLGNAMLAILDEDIDAGTVPTGVGVTARAYESGTFIRERVKFEAGGELTDADVLALARLGLLMRITEGTLNNQV